MNKLGIFVNFWEKNWACDLIKHIKRASEIGFDVLEFQAQALLEMDKPELAELKKTAADANIELTYSLGLDKRYDVSSRDEAVRTGGVEYLKRIIERIAFMEGKILSGVNYAGWGCVPTDLSGEKQAITEASVKSVKEVAKTANDYGITYCLEAVNRYEGCVINTAEEAVEYVKRVDVPNVGILLDTYHMNIEENSFREAIFTAGDLLKGFHTGDNNRRCPGRGHIDFDEIFKALADIKYTGRIVSEPFVTKGGEVGRDIFVWRDLECDTTEAALCNEAKYLLEYERNMLKKYS